VDALPARFGANTLSYKAEAHGRSLATRMFGCRPDSSKRREQWSWRRH
jgi:hypothetical protein